MFEFWLVVVLMLVGASLFLFVPLLSYKKNPLTNTLAGMPLSNEKELRTSENVQIYKERLQEIQDDRNNDLITAEQFESLKTELDKTLLDDAKAQTEEQSSGNKKHYVSEVNRETYVVVSVALIIVIFSSLFVYQKYGQYNNVESALTAQEIDTATSKAKQGDIGDLLRQLHSRLKENPDNLDGWGLLARSAMNTERYSLAIESFENIIRLLEEQGAIKQEVAAAFGIKAQAEYYQNDGVLAGAAQDSIDRALSIDPNELNSLALLAINAFTVGNYQDAVEIWENILTIQPEHPAKVSILGGIREAKSRLGLGNDKETESAQLISGPSIYVSVSAEDALLKDLDPNTPLFIFVKNAEVSDGPNIPLAASRHSISELPLSVTLSDANAMGPMAKLSDAKLVNVTARVALSGNPIAQAGDIQGELLSVEVQEEKRISLVIDKKL